MSTVTITVSAVHAGAFPFSGSWESQGSGFSDPDGNPYGIFSIGSVSSTDIAGAPLLVCGVVTGFGYGSTAPSPVVIIAINGALSQEYFSAVKITPASGGSGTQTLDPAAAIFNPVAGGGGGDPVAQGYTVWVWEVTTDTDFFAGGVASTVEFDFAPSAPVPYVIGSLVADGSAAIIAAGFTVGTVTGVDDASFAPGQIDAQSPAGGSSAPLGSAINLTQSLGPIYLSTKFVPAMAFKAILIANAGNINPRIYEPQIDSTVRIKPQRGMV